MPISETTVEVDKEVTFKYTKLAVKTVKCYWYYWIIQDLDATQRRLTYSMESHVRLCTWWSVWSLCMFSVWMKYLQKEKTNSCLAALTSAHAPEQLNLFSECCQVKMVNVLDLNHSDFMHFCFSWNDVTRVGIHRKCYVGRNAIFYDSEILQLTKTEKDHNIHKSPKKKKKKLQWHTMSEL